MYSWEEGRRRQRIAPMRRGLGFSFCACVSTDVPAESESASGVECHSATSVMLWWGSVMVSL